MVKMKKSWKTWTNSQEEKIDEQERSQARVDILATMITITAQAKGDLLSAPSSKQLQQILYPHIYCWIPRKQQSW